MREVIWGLFSVIATGGGLNELADGLTELASLFPAFDVHDAIVALVEPAEVDGPEEYTLDAVADLLEPDGEPSEEVRDEDLLTVPSDGGVLGDEPELEVVGIGDLRQPTRKRPERGLVDRSGRLLIQGLMGSFLVVDAPEVIEGALLSGERSTWRFGRVPLERSVHALVPAVLLRLSGLDERGCNPERDEVDGELREAAQGIRGEGKAVVGEHEIGKSVGPKQPFEARGRERQRLPGEAFALE